MPWRVLVLGWVIAATLLAAPGARADVRVGGPGTRAGTIFRECAHCPDMVVVSTGTFLLGPAAGDAVPQRVTLAHPFAYSKDRVSFRDWKHCVLAGQCQSLAAATRGTIEPVVQVSWVDVQQYLAWLTLETGAEYRLLSEAEWEYLAGSSSTVAPGFLRDGLEWTSDCWHPDHAGAPADGSSWERDGDCRYHVARGRRPGDGGPLVANRYRFHFDARDPALGFRVGRTIGK